MDVNIRTKKVSECVALTPFNLYETKLNIKQKIGCIMKRTIDIIAGLIGVVIIIPLTIVIFISQKFTKDKRPSIL